MHCRVIFLFLLLFASVLQAINMENTYLSVDFQEMTGQFSLNLKKGDPSLPSDDNHKLMGDILNSFLILNLDGDFYKFGDSQGRMSVREIRADRAEFVWTIQGIQVHQSLKFQKNPFTSVPSVVHVKYWLKNTDMAPHVIGLKIVYDTFLNPNDDGFFMAPGQEPVIGEKELSFRDVPAWWVSWDDPTAPYSRMMMSFTGKEETRPDRLTFAERKNMTAAFWDYSIRPGMGFRNSRLEQPDTAVAMRWDPIKFPSGYENGIGFTYGVVQAEQKSLGSLDLVLLYPSVTDGSDFWILAQLMNTDEAKSLRDVHMTIESADGLSLLPGSSAEQRTGDVGPEETRTVFWKIKPSGPGPLIFKVTAMGMTAKGPALNIVSGRITVEP